MPDETHWLRELHDEVAAIADYVAEIRQAIQGLRAPELAGDRLPGMRNDLTAVRDTTRLAADRILDMAEDLLTQATAGQLDAAYIEARMLELMEACSFQDLSGQRIQRMQDMLNAVEDRLSHFVERVRAGNAMLDETDAEERLKRRNEVRLTHGPSNVGALGQTDIDQILKSA